MSIMRTALTLHVFDSGFLFVQVLLYRELSFPGSLHMFQISGPVTLLPSGLSTHRMWLFLQIYVLVVEMAFYIPGTVCFIPVRFLVFWDPFLFMFCSPLFYFSCFYVNVTQNPPTCETSPLSSLTIRLQPTCWGPVLFPLPASLLFLLGTPGLTPLSGCRLCC